MTHTLLKGTEKVNGEFALIFLAYNFSRIMTMIKDNVLKVNEIDHSNTILAISATIKHCITKFIKMQKSIINDFNQFIYLKFDLSF